jgi:hypothetical protein
MSDEPARKRINLHTALLVGLVAAVAGVGTVLWSGLAELTEQQKKNKLVLDEVLGEVTRMRLEQSAGSKGPQALLDKLHLYAPLAADSRTTEPDFKNAQKEMAAIVRAFRTLGKDAWRPIQDRLAELKPENDFEEIKQLLCAAVAVDHEAGVKLLEQVLLGHKLPSPRLRWLAGRELIKEERALAQIRLRQVLLTETSKGFDPTHAGDYPGAVVPDRAAMSERGFENFVEIYELSGDPQADDTLLMVIGRSIDDRVTVQSCVKILGNHRYARAVPVIEKLYQQPPLGQQDPLFLGYCLEALVDIQGAEARPFLENALPNASSDTVAKKIQYLLQKIASGNLAPKLRPAPVNK